MLLSEAFTSYARDVIAFKNQSRKTTEMSALAFKSLQKHVGNIDVSLLTFEHVRKWKEKLEDERKSVNTIRGYIIKLRCVLTYLRKLRIECIDTDLIPVPKRIETVPAWLTPEEVSLLIECCSNIRGKAILSLLYASGIRVSELCSLNRDQLHEGRFTIIGKGQKARLCFYDSRASMYIKKYLLSRHDNSPALFIQRTSSSRIRPAGVQEICIAARKKAELGKTVTPHSFRHSFATDLMSNGLPIYSLSRMMGHTSIQTTATYLNVTNPRLQEEYLRFHKS